MERLQKILSQAGVASRRASEQLMLDGRVTVNGTTVRELGTKADPARDDIRVDGRRIKLAERHRYLLAQQAARLRHDAIGSGAAADGHRSARASATTSIRSAGSTSIPKDCCILTNDGDLAARLTHPSHGVARVYEARVAGIPDAHDLERLSRGIVIEGRRTEPAASRWCRPRDDGEPRCGSRFTRAGTGRCARCATRSVIRSIG